ncbi:MAG: RsmD family RNA methyltransferase, partial [Dietzia sp.]
RRAALPAAVAGPCPVAGGFHLVLADPPYDRSGELDAPVLRALSAGGWLAGDALVVWERSKRDPAVRWPDGYEVEFERTYGETAVEIARPVDTVGR